MFALVFISIQYWLDRLWGSRSRAEELREVRRRLADQAGPSVVSAEELKLASKLRKLREELAAQIGSVNACGSCARPRSENWPGGDCCSGATADLFPNSELAALRLSGTTSRQLRQPHRSHRGCVFRGPLGCSLKPAHRPSLCIRYLCFDLQRELEHRPDSPKINQLLEELYRTVKQFENRRNQRLEANWLKGFD